MSNHERPTTTVHGQAAVVKPAINQLLQDQSGRDGPQLEPRRYQTELCSRALAENVIIHLGTGLGKTFIIVLYLNSPQIVEQIRGGRKVIFMTPTQDLTKQQAQYIHMHLPHRIKVYCGKTCYLGTHIDHWKKEVWDAELREVDVLVMTPQIFASAISTNLLDWTNFSAVIFDECHHSASVKAKESKHPYSQILSSYSHYYRLNTSRPRPRMIGLTASLINSMPKNIASIHQGVSKLEGLFQGRCVTDIDVLEHKPKMVIHGHNDSQVNEDNDLLYRLLIELSEVLKRAVEAQKIKAIDREKPYTMTSSQTELLAFHNRLKLAAVGISIKPNSFYKVVKHLALIRANCGLYSLQVVCQMLEAALEKHGSNNCLCSELKPIYENFVAILKSVRSSIDDLIGGTPESKLIQYTRPKLMALLEILESEHKRALDLMSDKSTFSCIVFVQSRLEVVALNKWLVSVSREIPKFNFIKSDYAIGLSASASSKYSCITKRKSTEQFQMLENFRRGELNVIVTTSVLEEGIDLPVCSTVIRYDEARTFRVYVQSRGRARQKISSFIAMCSQQMMIETQSNLNKMNDFEHQIKLLLKSKQIGPVVRMEEAQKSPSTQPLGNNDQANTAGIIEEEAGEECFFTAKENAILISSSEARIILHMYCARLSGRYPYTNGVRYDRALVGRYYRTALYMPPHCPLTEPILGKPKSDEILADGSAIVAAFKALYESGELDEHGVPVRQTEESIAKLLAEQNLAPKYEPLDPHRSGRPIDKDGREYYLFCPKTFQFDNYMSRGYMDRSYKLLRLKFIPQSSEQVRADVACHFSSAAFGLIVDASTTNEFVPTIIHSHYGVFLVVVEEISPSFRMIHQQDHNEFLNFTYKLLTRCLNVGRFRRDNFKDRCLFYLALLSTNNHPNFDAMRGSFERTGTTLTRLQVGDVVKLGAMYEEDNFENRDRLMLVRRVHTEMDANSQIPNFRVGTTFKAYFEEKYGRTGLLTINQPVIEVMPIAKEYGSIRQGKKIDSNATTQSLYYLNQYLDLFNADANCVFQAFNLPEIIYRLYITSSVSQLDEMFRSTTKDKRLDEQPVASVKPQELIIEGRHPKQAQVASEGELMSGDITTDVDKFAKQPESGVPDEGEAQKSDEEELDEDEEEEGQLSSDTDDSSDQSSDAEELTRSAQIKDMLAKRCLDLKKFGERGRPERWDLSQYKVQNLVTQQYEYVKSNHQDRSPASDPKYHNSMADLTNELQSRKAAILLQIQNIKSMISTGIQLTGEEDSFNAETLRVDHSIRCPLLFDRSPGLIKGVAREKALIEALTLGKAGESYSLEGFENVGDSYLKYVVSVVLYKYFDGDEGQLTLARSHLVCNKNFTHLARQRCLGSYAIERGFDRNLLANLLSLRPDNLDDKQLIRLRSKDLADLFEAIVGSYLLHNGEFEAILAIDWLGLNIFSEGTFDEFHRGAVVFSRFPTALLEADRKECRDFFKSCSRSVERFEDILGYKFNDKSYLVQAITHASAPTKCTKSYERLEFLGDAILDYLVTVTLYTTGQMTKPGQITTSRSQLVNNCSLARLALKYKFEYFISYSNYELYTEITRVKLSMEDDPEMNYLDLSDFDKITKLLGDLFESVAGAIYLDSGGSLDTVWGVFYPMMKVSIEREIKEPSKNDIVLLYESFPGANRIVFQEQAVCRDGSITVSCTIKGFKVYHGRGMSKRQAKMRAIEKAVEDIPSKERLDQLNEPFLRSKRRPGGQFNRGLSGNRGRGGRGAIRGGRGGMGSIRGGRGRGYQRHPSRAG